MRARSGGAKLARSRSGPADHARGASGMNVLVYLVPMALGLGLIGLFAFLWSLKTGQYDDLDGAALRILDNDDLTEKPDEK